MARIIQLKKGSQAQADGASLVIGELAYTTDTKRLYVGDGIGKTLIADSQEVIGLFSDGSVSVPAIRFTSDPDTGVYRISGNTLGFSASGMRIMDIDTDGLYLTYGTRVNEFSTDGTLAGDSDDAVPTEKAVKTYVDAATGGVAVDSIYEGDTKVETVDTGTGYITFTTDNSEAMRIDENGKVGIGTDDPDSPLHIWTGNSGGSPHPSAKLTIEHNTSSYIQFLNPADSEVAILFGDPGTVNAGNISYLHHSNSLTFRVNEAERMRIDSDGNVGFGVTPKTWQADWTALQVGGTTSIMARTSESAAPNSNFLTNAYYDGSMKYIQNNLANRYFQNSGDHRFQVAPSGTADTSITWEDVFVVKNSGRVGVGTTGPSTTFDVVGTGNFSSHLTVGGDLTVSGTNFITSTEHVSASDNIITINAGETGTGVTSGFAGIEIDRGSLDRYHFKFRESDDTFTIGISGSPQAVATREDSPSDTGVAYWDDTAKQFKTDNGFVFTSGKVGIGISPTYYFDVYHSNNKVARFSSSDSQCAILISDDDTTNYMVSEDGYFSLGGGGALSTMNLNINSSTGYVGIGTTSPGYTLEMRDSSANVQLRLTETGNDPCLIGFNSNRNATSSTLGSIDTYWNSTNVASISFFTGDDTTNKDDGYITFSVAEGGLKTEAMRIEQNGKVGIGSTPTYDFEVVTNNAATVVKIQNSEGENAALGLKVESSTHMIGDLWSGSPHSEMALYTAGSARMKIDSSGNVGIGNSSLESWDGDLVALQVGGSASIVGHTSIGALRLLQNAYYDGADWKYQDTDEASQYFQSASGKHYFQVAASGTADTAITWTTAMLVDNDGKVGLGTTSPDSYNTNADNLVIAGSGSESVGLTIVAGTSNNSNIYFADGTTGSDTLRGYISYNHSLDALYLGSNAATRIYIDSVGNVGIGNSSLEAWHSSYTTLQIGGNASIFAHTAQSDNGSFLINQNAYYSDLWRYISTDEASNYNQSNGTHQFKVAASGTADAAITWINAIHIDNAGQVGIGDTSPSYELDVNGDINCTGVIRVDGIEQGTGSWWTSGGSSDIYRLGGSVGLGTDNPGDYHSDANNLVVYEAGNVGITIATGISNQGAIYFADGTSGDAEYRGRIIYNHGTDLMTFGTGGSQQMFINASGNVGIKNSSLESWSSSYTALQIGGLSALMVNTSPSTGDSLSILQNAYNDGSWKYQITDEASRYAQIHGTHGWKVAASGTADTAITWTNALFIDNNANIGMGVTSLETWYGAYTALQIGGNGSIASDTSPAAGNVIHISQNVYRDASAVWRYISTDEASNYYQNDGTHRFNVAASGTADAAISWIAAMAIDNAGNVGIQKTPEAWYSTRTAIEIGGGGSITGRISGGASGHIAVCQNTYVGSGPAYRYQDTDEASMYFQQHGTHSFKVAASGSADGTISFTDAMTIDNVGNVGIGNASLESWLGSYTALQIGGNAALMTNTTAGASANFHMLQNAYHDGSWKYISTDQASKFSQSDGQHIFQVAASGTADAAITWSTAMIVDNAGNVGIGNSSLESWGSTFTALQIGGNTSIMSDSAPGSSKQLNISLNSYYDGSWKYISTDEASAYRQYDGKHVFRVASLGSADTAISWTNAVTIDNSGHVGIRTTSPSSYNSSADDLVVGDTTGTSHGITIVSRNDASTYLMFADNDDSNVGQIQYNHSTGDMQFVVEANTALKIDSAGNVGIGNTSLESWVAGTTTLQLGGNASLFADTTAGTGKSFYLFQNAYYSDNFRYQNTDEASYYFQGGGKHTFKVAASGTADTAITWIDAMHIDNVGNVGIGNSSLESWDSSFTGLQIGGNGCISANTAAGASKLLAFTQNAYIDGSWKYQDTDEASMYYQYSGKHFFRVATSGTADAAITWTTALQISNDGSTTFGNKIILQDGPSIDSAENTNVDSGGETVDTFADTDGDACVWHYSIKKGGNLRAGTVTATWSASGDTVVSTEVYTNDIGDTNDVALSVDINSNNVRLIANTISDDWSIKVIRMLL